MMTTTKSTSDDERHPPSPIPTLSPESIPLRVLIVRGPDPLVTEPFEVHCLEYEFVEAGASPSRAFRNWLNAFHGHIQSDLEDGQEPLHNVPTHHNHRDTNTDMESPPTDIELAYELAVEVLGISASPFFIRVRSAVRAEP